MARSPIRRELKKAKRWLAPCPLPRRRIAASLRAQLPPQGASSGGAASRALLRGRPGAILGNSCQNANTPLITMTPMMAYPNFNMPAAG